MHLPSSNTESAALLTTAAAGQGDTASHCRSTPHTRERCVHTYSVHTYTRRALSGWMDGSLVCRHGVMHCSLCKRCTPNSASDVLRTLQATYSASDVCRYSATDRQAGSALRAPHIIRSAQLGCLPSWRDDTSDGARYVRNSEKVWGRKRATAHNGLTVPCRRLPGNVMRACDSTGREREGTGQGRADRRKCTSPHSKCTSAKPAGQPASHAPRTAAAIAPSAIWAPRPDFPDGAPVGCVHSVIRSTYGGACYRRGPAIGGRGLP